MDDDSSLGRHQSDQCGRKASETTARTAAATHHERLQKSRLTQCRAGATLCGMVNNVAHRISTGLELRAEREDAELTQTAIAEAMGVHRSTVAMAEARAKVRPSFARRYREAIAKLAR